MPDSIVVTFDSGNTVRFGTPEPGGGLAPVGLINTGKIAETANENFSRALGALGDVVARLETAIGGLAKRPDHVEIEFSASLKGECDLWVVSGEAEAEFKVKLVWGK